MTEATDRMGPEDKQAENAESLWHWRMLVNPAKERKSVELGRILSQTWPQQQGPRRLRQISIPGSRS